LPTAVPAAPSFTGVLPLLRVGETASPGDWISDDLTDYVTAAAADTAHVFELVPSGPSGGAADLFTIPEPTVLRVAVAPSGQAKPLDYEHPSRANPSVLAVRVTDAFGQTAAASLMIEVTDEAEAPRVVAAPDDIMAASARRFVHGELGSVRIDVQAIFADDDAADRNPAARDALHSLSYELQWRDPPGGNSMRSLQELSDELFGGRLQRIEASPGTLPAGHLELLGTPSFGPALILESAVPQSPTRREVTLRIVATDSTSASAVADVSLAVEIGGCTVKDAAWDASLNPQGNYNPYASLPRPVCRFPAVAIPRAPGAVGRLRMAGSDGDPESPGASEVAISGGTRALAADGVTTVDALTVQGAFDVFASGGAPRLESGSLVGAAAIILGPAGATFDPPVTLRMYVGSVGDGSSAVIMTAQATGTGAGAASAYGALEQADGCVYTPEGGGFVECTTSHFSLAVPVVVPFADADVVRDAELRTGGGCPSMCSGNGECLAHAVCQCFEGWTGGDCGLRTCPGGQAWPGASRPFPFHQWAECSGRGLCDRMLGECTCFAGHEGAACQRLACPRDCSGRGQCLTMDAMSGTLGYGSAPAAYGGAPLLFTAERDDRLKPQFEASRMSACECDPGYAGHDCSKRQCPTGDDPVTECGKGGLACDGAQHGRVTELRLSFVTSGVTVAAERDEMALDVLDARLGSMRTRPVLGLWAAAAAPSAEALRRALVTLPGQAVRSARVERTVSTLTTRAWSITWTAPENSGPVTAVLCPGGARMQGCGEDGCAPWFRQMLAVDTSGTTGTAGHVVLDDTTSFDGAGDASSPAEFDAEVVLTVTAGTPFPVFVSELRSPSAAAAAVDGPSGAVAGPEDPTVGTDLTPAPLVVSVGRGLVLRFSTLAPDPGRYVFRVSAPTCSAEVVRDANPGYEGAECSNRGTCNSLLGECRCYAGFEGAACSRMTALA